MRRPPCGISPRPLSLPLCATSSRSPVSSPRISAWSLCMTLRGPTSPLRRLWWRVPGNKRARVHDHGLCSKARLWVHCCLRVASPHGSHAGRGLPRDLSCQGSPLMPAFVLPAPFVCLSSLQTRARALDTPALPRPVRSPSCFPLRVPSSLPSPPTMRVC